MKRPTIDEMRQHVLGMLDPDDFEWCERPSHWREDGIIRIPRIRSEISYATALHEIGHMRGKHQESRRVMVREEWAWRWAKAAALFWTPRMEKDRQEALDWYRPRARRFDARWRPAVVGDPA